MTELDTKSAKACRMRGLLGEKYAVRRLRDGLRAFVDEENIVHESERDQNAPFDIVIKVRGKPFIGIENKDLYFRNGKIVGTTIRKAQKKRKLAYAEANGIRFVMTSITLRDKDMIGFSIGLVNSTVNEFAFDEDGIDVIGDLIMYRMAEDDYADA